MYLATVYRSRHTHNWFRIFLFENIFQWSPLVRYHLEIMSLTTTFSILNSKTTAYTIPMQISHKLHTTPRIYYYYSYFLRFFFFFLLYGFESAISANILHFAKCECDLCSLPHSRCSYSTKIKCLFYIVRLAFCKDEHRCIRGRDANTQTECFVPCMNGEQTTERKTFLCSLAYMTIICHYVVHAVFIRWKKKESTTKQSHKQQEPRQPAATLQRFSLTADRKAIVIIKISFLYVCDFVVFLALFLCSSAKL